MKRVFYPTQSNSYDMFCSTSDLMTIQETPMFFSPQPLQQPQLANWQINPPPYPFKIIDDNNSNFPLTVSKEGINTYAFGTPIIANIKDPMYSQYRLCGEGECDINTLNQTL